MRYNALQRTQYSQQYVSSSDYSLIFWDFLKFRIFLVTTLVECFEHKRKQYLHWIHIDNTLTLADNLISNYITRQRATSGRRWAVMCNYSSAAGGARQYWPAAVKVAAWTFATLILTSLCMHDESDALISARCRVQTTAQSSFNMAMTTVTVTATAIFRFTWQQSRALMFDRSYVIFLKIKLLFSQTAERTLAKSTWEIGS